MSIRAADGDMKVELVSELEMESEEDEGQDEDEEEEEEEVAVVWDELGGGRVACVRRAGERLVSARAVALAVRSPVRAEVFACARAALKAKAAREGEALVLSAMNPSTPGTDLHTAPARAGEPLLRLRDARHLLHFLETCAARLAGHPGPCGLLQLHTRTLIPYIFIYQRRYVPSFYFLNEPDVLKLNITTVNKWDLAYLKFCCKVSGADADHLSADTCSTFDLEDVMKCYPPDTEFREYWPKNPLKFYSNADDKAQHTQIAEEPMNAPSKSYPEQFGHVSTTANCTNTMGTDFHNVKRRRSSGETGIDDVQKLKRRAKLIQESPEQREKRLAKLRYYQSRRIANETEEQRKIRLEKMRLHNAKRMASETPEERERRLAKTRLYQQERLAKLKQKTMKEMSNTQKTN